jgi:hypothetical protein
MPKAVIDRLEMIQIEYGQQPDRSAARACPVQLDLHQAAVRHPRQGIDQTQGLPANDAVLRLL